MSHGVGCRAVTLKQIRLQHAQITSTGPPVVSDNQGGSDPLQVLDAMDLVSVIIPHQSPVTEPRRSPDTGREPH